MLVCPNENCKKPFKVDVPRAKPVEELILPPGVEEEKAPAVAAPVAQPAGEVPEETLATVRLTMFRRYPLRYTLYVVVVLASIVGAVYFWVPHMPIVSLLCIVVGGLTAYRLVVWWLRIHNTRFIVTNKRCVLESGVFTRQFAEVQVNDIEDIQVTQTFLQRLLNVGDLCLKGKKGASQTAVILGAPAPREVALLIHDHHPQEAGAQK